MKLYVITKDKRVLTLSHDIEKDAAKVGMTTGQYINEVKQITPALKNVYTI